MPFLDARYDTITLQDAADAGLTAVLSPYDGDGDGELDFTELYGSGSFLVPRGDAYFAITTQTDFRTYAALVTSAANIKRQTGAAFLAQRTCFEAHDAASWLFSAGARFSQDAVLATAFDGDVEVCEIATVAGKTTLYCRDLATRDSYGGYFFSVTLVEDPDAIRIEINGQKINPNVVSTENAMESWRGQILTALYSLFSNTTLPLPGTLYTAARDRFEILMLRANPALAIEAPPGMPTAPDVLARAKEIDAGKSPLAAKAVVARGGQKNYPLIFCAETPLTAAENKTLQGAVDLVPAALWDALDQTGKMAQLKFEFVAPEIAGAWSPSGWGGLYEKRLNKIFFLRGYVADGRESFLADFFVHELSHRLELLVPPDSFLGSYFNAKKALIPTANENPFVSPYAAGSAGEFIAESIVAYFNGDQDAPPIIGKNYGQRTRGELCRKTPELYLALRLFFEKDSPRANDVRVFSQENMPKYQRLLVSRTIDALSPATTVAALASALG